MYMTPASTLKTFDWEQRDTGLNGRGKATLSYSPAGQVQGVLAESSPVEKLRYQQLQHPVTHQIVVKGVCNVVRGDRLTLNGHRYYVQDFQDVGQMGLWTIYYCEERADL